MGISKIRAPRFASLIVSSGSMRKSFECRDVLGSLDQVHPVRGVAERSLDLDVAGVADQHDLLPLLREAARLDVYLRHQRARRVDRAKPLLRGRLANGRRDAVGAVDQQCARRSVGGVVHEHGALRTQPFHDVSVVHDLVAHVHRRPVASEGGLHDLDGPVDPGAEAARIGQQDSHGREG
jgi:hypothetical protein